MNNLTYQKAWFDVFKNHKISEATCHITGFDHECLKLYQDFVRSHYQDALEKMYPRLQELISFDWEEITTNYYEDYPPIAWDLNELSFHFPDFLQKNIDRFNLQAFHIELARYEVLEFKVYMHPKEEFFDLTSIVINQTLEICEFSYDIANWVKQMDHYEQQERYQDLKNSIPQKIHNFLGICRHSQTHFCVFSKLGLLDLFIIELLRISQLGGQNLIATIQNGLAHFGDYTFSQADIVKSLDFLSKQSILNFTV
jgi:hypothetical protein